jgi:putative ABC transport system permease protein
MLVFDRGMQRPGNHVTVYVGSVAGEGTEVRLPAQLVRREGLYAGLPTALIPASAAREHGWELMPARGLVSFDTAATEDQIDAAMGAAQRFGAVADIEDGPQTDDQIGLIVAALGAAFVTLVGVAISVALSAAEALLVAGGGSLLGVAIGAFVAFTARATAGSTEFVVPWLNLAVTVLVVPLLAVLVAALFTPSRLPLARRAT